MKRIQPVNGMVRNVIEQPQFTQPAPHQAVGKIEPLPMPAWNFEQKEEEQPSHNRQRATPGVVEPLLLPRTF